MDALKFLKEFDRMCNHYFEGSCAGCPREECSGCDIYTMDDKELMELVSDVEQWSKEHIVAEKEENK